jgi:hypothetical protein
VGWFSARPIPLAGAWRYVEFEGRGGFAADLADLRLKNCSVLLRILHIPFVHTRGRRTKGQTEMTQRTRKISEPNHPAAASPADRTLGTTSTNKYFYSNQQFPNI